MHPNFIELMWTDEKQRWTQRDLKSKQEKAQMKRKPVCF